MKIVEPTALMREAAAALAPVVNDVVVIGAVAIGVALGRDGTNARKHGATWDVDLVVPIAPTRDIDLAVERDAAPRIVRALKDAGLEPSTDDGERGFTWVSGDLRVQLMTPLGGPRRMGDALRLPVQPALSLVSRHRREVAFAASPTMLRFWCATPAALVALKRAAFGRRTHEGVAIERDYHDAFQLLAAVGLEIVQELATVDDPGLTMQVRAAAEDLADGGHATERAARERVKLNLAATERAAEREIVREARLFLRDLESGA